MTRRRMLTAASILGVGFVGMFSKSYRGVLSGWVNDSLGGVFYEIFWCLFIFFLFAKVRPWKIALGVLLVTGTLEFMQLWHPPFLEFLRRSQGGQAMLGHYFAWSDFPYYFIGGGIGGVWMSRLRALDADA